MADRAITYAEEGPNKAYVTLDVHHNGKDYSLQVDLIIGIQCVSYNGLPLKSDDALHQTILKTLIANYNLNPKVNNG